MFRCSCLCFILMRMCYIHAISICFHILRYARDTLIHFGRWHRTVAQLHDRWTVRHRPTTGPLVAHLHDRAGDRPFSGTGPQTPGERAFSGPGLTTDGPKVINCYTSPQVVGPK